MKDRGREIPPAYPVRCSHDSVTLYIQTKQVRHYSPLLLLESIHPQMPWSMWRSLSSLSTQCYSTAEWLSHLNREIKREKLPTQAILTVSKFYFKVWSMWGLLFPIRLFQFLLSHPRLYVFLRILFTKILNFTSFGTFWDQASH